MELGNGSQRYMKNKAFRYTQAKLMGGGSTINAQIYNRGNSQYYKDWLRAGCEGWAYEDILLCFKSAEDNDII